MSGELAALLILGLLLAIVAVWTFPSKPDCLTCGRYRTLAMHGTGWHNDSCPETRPRYWTGSDDE